MLNDFLNCREYEKRINEKNKKIYSELRYVQDLLLAETDDHTDPPMQAKVDVYVAYLKEQRATEKTFRDFKFK